MSLAPSQLFSSVDAGDAVLTPSQIDRRHKKERLRGEELGESNTSTPQEVLWNGQARGRLGYTYKKITIIIDINIIAGTAPYIVRTAVFMLSS